MGTIYARGQRLWLGFRDAAGKRRLVSSGLVVGQEAQAKLLLRELELRARHALPAAPTGASTTVGAYLDGWTARRRREGLTDAIHEDQRIRTHAKQLLEVPLAAVRHRHIRDLVATLKGRIGHAAGELAPRTVRKVYGSLHTLFEHAIADELLEVNPCNLRRGELPKKVDKDPLWRGGAVFTRGEAESLLSDPRLPEVRRMVYALALLTGMRMGEISALRWSAIDLEAAPLARLTVAYAYDRKGRRVKSTKTGEVREVPVHPTLRPLLAAWRLGGFARHLGRPPTAEDLVVPNASGRFLKDVTFLPMLHRDLELLGLRRRRFHDMRRTFITLAQVDGAPREILRSVTHTPRGDIMDLYTSLPWASKCAAVACLKLEVRPGAQVLQLQRAAGARAATPAATVGPSDAPSLRRHGRFDDGQGGTRTPTPCGTGF